MNCMKCETNEATIHVLNQGDFCHRCHQELIEKLANEAGLSLKTIANLSEYQPPVGTTVEDDCYLHVQPIGTVEILADDDANPSLRIDGEIVDFMDFGRGLTYFADHNLHFQICDPADDVLGRDTVLALVSIDPEAIYKRFEKTLGWFVEDNFLSEKRVAHCEEALFERLEDLRLLNRYGNQATAGTLAERLKERLLAIKHTDSLFPAALVKRVDHLLQHYLATAKPAGL